MLLPLDFLRCHTIVNSAWIPRICDSALLQSVKSSFQRNSTQVHTDAVLGEFDLIRKINCHIDVKVKYIFNDVGIGICFNSLTPKGKKYINS